MKLILSDVDGGFLNVGGEKITEAEKQTARKLIKENAVNYDGEIGLIDFLENKDDLRGITL